ncbi:hypothetical protein [Vibrio cholerae]|uniref:hypothetical protein n=1 Tax=Vibrio cholerae TaxID=666 RepID=UPI00163C6942|nr:hypothetical protein [Vibrio cholerae]EHE6949524.1 hypothetical protein [Vibrio cholerae]ELD8765378.1 hypothetical protein [Vibrio cholerae]GIA97136.1 Hypothetical protein VCSRO41_3463 [Vibrio cholerae]
MNLATYVRLITMSENFSLTAEQYQLLNADLATKTISDIPQAVTNDLENYLSNVLAHGTVEASIVSQLDELLERLRETA